MSCHVEAGDEPSVKAALHATVNPCTLCAPLGAVLAAAGVQGAMSLLHGAQGCATYIRRYLISHFREPVDVASSSFTEASAVMGGENEFMRAIDNIRRQYDPELIAVGTTCLAETIGEDLGLMIRTYRKSRAVTLPVVHASTPSYRDGHVEGFHAMVRALVTSQAGNDDGDELPARAAAGECARINLLPPIVSPADLRHLRELVMGFGLDLTMLPDYSNTLDGPIHDRYHPLPSGGTSVAEIRAMVSSRATVDLTLPGVGASAGAWLQTQGVANRRLGLPIGVQATDALVELLEELSGREAPDWLQQERGRLLDAYADGHKYVFGKRVAVFGDPELVVAVSKFLREVGARPVLCATGARNRALSGALGEVVEEPFELVLEDTDFSSIEAASQRLGVELMIGNSKGYRASRVNGVPLLRLGFPIHDRIGASRILSVGYRGSVNLFDTIVNILLQRVQDVSEVGYSYL
jgi:nitrogenase molybdenum-iron protein NifN